VCSLNRYSLTSKARVYTSYIYLAFTIDNPLLCNRARKTKSTVQQNTMASASTILITGATGLIGSHVVIAALTAGHNVRFTARSESKAQTVTSSPAIQKLAAGGRLSAVIIPDLSIDGAWETILQDVTHVIHVGSPVPWPTLDPLPEVFQPTLKMTSGLLAAALKTPSVQRVVTTSSIVAHLGLVPAATTVTANTRAPLPSPFSTTFSNV
jgi:nucleoside-diphosphate-sugar epimerase